MFLDEYVAKVVELEWITNSNNAAQQLIDRANRDYPRYLMQRSYEVASGTPTYHFRFTVSVEDAMTLTTVLKQMEGV